MPDLQFNKDRCYVVGSGIRKTAREKDFMHHLHANLLRIWNSGKDEKPQTFVVAVSMDALRASHSSQVLGSPIYTPGCRIRATRRRDVASRLTSGAERLARATRGGGS